MAPINSRNVRRALLAISGLVVASLVLASPALAGGGRGHGYKHGHWHGHHGPARVYRGGYWAPPFPLPPLPGVVVSVPFPPVVVVPGPPVAYPAYGYYGDGREYDRGYEDGWRDRDRDGYYRYRRGPY
jgi:hypothetical protein